MRTRQRVLEILVLSLAAAWLCLSKPTDRKSVFLPPSLIPEHYEISLAPRLDKGVFQGVVVISGIAIAVADRIVLHCKNLLFNTTSLTDLTTDEELVIEDIEEDIILQQCHLLLNQSLRVDHEYRLSLEFMGLIGKAGVGLYRDSYEEEGVKHEILMTHFQPNYARMMFPCFDEPHYKAQFLLRVARQHFPTVLSNMPPVSALSHPDSEDVNQTWVEFEETPPMSTYLLVLVMCDYLTLSDSVTNNSVWAPRSRLHEAQLALNVSIAVLEHCERYFDVEFALPKLDHVPVQTLNTLAMENWGAITYRRDFLLWEEGVSTWAQKEMVTYVICHEVVHQWLGDLVTTAWWNTTWLNEGVATFFHFYVMDKVQPTWKVFDNVFVTQIYLILAVDTTKEQKPLTINEPFPQESIASAAFGEGTYLKGAAIMRMVFNLMAPDIFREAIVQYITDNEYGSVDEEDFWQSLATVSDLSVDLQSAMYTWTHQPGYPLVTVQRDQHGCISVNQEKYLAKDDTNARWAIPLTFTTSSELDYHYPQTIWLMEDHEHMELRECLEPDDWIIFNIRQSGFYRVNYDPVTWRVLTHDLQNCDLSDFHPVNRAQLLLDSFDLARHRYLDYSVPFQLARYLTRETEYLPWYVAIQELSWLRSRLHNTDIFQPLQHYSLNLVENMFSQTVFSGEAGGQLQELHRKQIVEFACGLRHPRCVKEAMDTTYLLMSGVHVEIPLDLKPVLLCAAVRDGQDEVWHFVLKEYQTAAENERWKYLVALACTSNRELMHRLLKNVANSDSFIKSSEERLNLLFEVGKQDNSIDPILDMILQRFNALSANFDFGAILHIVKFFMTSKVAMSAKQKISDVEALVRKTHNSKHIELIESITTDIKDSLDEESVRRALMMEINEEEEDENIVTTLSPKVLEKDVTTVSLLPDSQGESTQASVSKDKFGEVNRESGTTDKTISVGTRNSSRNTAKALSVFVIFLTCVMRTIIFNDLSINIYH